ncbi:cellular nucleic acid-binding protein, partial [Trifolium medium]|nr:cellular nucleic acid-binding protein [Trifolium medium]
MAGRNDQAIVNALTAVAQAIQGNQNQHEGNDECRLDRFLKQEPPKFDGGHNPDDAYKWLQDIERIFRVMDATDAQRVMMATNRLTDEA